uniref:G-protein coupled receptors family 1 profile domain-containing protein n=1 Tax=Aquila chrysaetos chrysaetos TaxID=223781 RepID=A0A663DX70_AQUCH
CKCCFLHGRLSCRLKCCTLLQQITNAKGQPKHPERVHSDRVFPLPRAPGCVVCAISPHARGDPGWKYGDNGCYRGGSGSARAHVSLPRCPVLLGALLHLLHHPKDAVWVSAGNSSHFFPGLCRTNAFLLHLWLHALFPPDGDGLRPLPFCQSHRIDHFFCHVPPLLQLACAGGEVVATIVNVLCMTTLLGCCLFILLSYAFILGRILQMPSAEGRHKTFSTCASHVAVVVVHYGCASVIYLQCKSPHAAGTNALIDVSYTVFTPFLSPIIFSLRSKELKNALWKSLRKSFVITNANFWLGSSLSCRSTCR